MDGGALSVSAWDLLAVAALVYLASRLWRFLILALPEPDAKKQR